MLFLLFQLGSDRYLLPAHHVQEVLPLVELKEIPQAPAGVAGVFSYHGEPVPVLDLSKFLLGRCSHSSLSTRIVLVHFRGELLGLIAERATGTLRREESDFVPSGVTVDCAPCLGPVITDESGVIQRIELDRLLPQAVQEALFRKVGASA